MSNVTQTKWHTLTVIETVAELETDIDNGLTQQQVKERIQQFGQNKLEERGGRKPWKILWEQVTSVMVLILIAAAASSSLVRLSRAEQGDSSIIF